MRSFLVPLIAIAIFMTPLVLIQNSCAPAVGSTNYAGGRNQFGSEIYMGSASVGDQITYSISYLTKNISFSNITRNYSWKSTFSIQPDGTRKFTVPVLDTTGYFVDAPHKALMVNFTISTNFNTVYSGSGIPSLAILTPNGIDSAGDLEKMKGLYYVFMNNRIETNNWLNGMYALDDYVLDLKIPTSDIYIYDGGTGMLELNPIFHPTFFYSNQTAYGTSYFNGVTNLSTVTANGITLSEDLGLNKGFNFGCIPRTNATAPADFLGKYIVMYIEQARPALTTVLSTNRIVTGFWILSNATAGDVEVYFSTNDMNYAKIDTLNFGDVYINIPGFGVGTGHMAQSGFSPWLRFVPSYDMSLGMLREWVGDYDDTNTLYIMAIGLAIRVQ